MPPEAIAGEAPAKLAPAWRRGLARLALAWAALILVFLPEWRAMAYQWWSGPSYSHVLVVPAILLWLVSLRAGPLLRLSPRCWGPGLGLLAAAGMLWALGAFMGIAVASEAGAVAALAACVPLLLGVRVAAGLVFPLGYMVFLVPVGDELVPPLQMLTARMTVALAHLSGVPAVIDGVFIQTPAGLFEIADACSGVRFLIAMVAFGVLAANVCFVSWRRRVVFLAACVVLPVLANGVRAWGTVYAAQIWGAARAGGFDHIFYGWIFFAIVVAGTLLVSWRWFDREAGAEMIDAGAIAASPRLARWERWSVNPALALMLAGVLAIGARGWVEAANGLHAAVPAGMVLPEVPGWRQLGDAPQPAWQPRASGAVRRAMASYTSGGQRVDVFVALYDGQGPGRKATTLGEGAVPAGSLWRWQGPGPDGGERMLGPQGVSRLAETRYRSADVLTDSRLTLALVSARDRLALRPRPTEMVIFSASERPGVPAAKAISAFLAALGPLDRWVDNVYGSGAVSPGPRG
jgi:exosortase A